MKQIFDAEYKTAFAERGLLERSGGDLQHLISDAATMQLIRWTDGGFGMAAHNYDGDMCTYNQLCYYDPCQACVPFICRAFALIVFLSPPLQ